MQKALLYWADIVTAKSLYSCKNLPQATKSKVVPWLINVQDNIQGSRYRSPLSPNAHKKKHDVTKTNGEKKSPHKKIAIEISPINKLQCTEYLSNNYFNPLIDLPVLLTVSYMYL